MVMIPLGGALGSYFSDGVDVAPVTVCAGGVLFWVVNGAAYTVHVSINRQTTSTGINT